MWMLLLKMLMLMIRSGVIEFPCFVVAHRDAHSLAYTGTYSYIIEATYPTYRSLQQHTGRPLEIQATALVPVHWGHP